MMFELADSKKIGRYLAERIGEQFSSRRQFCKAYLEAACEQVDNIQIQKMANRLSQILKGEKWIQLRDLPVFCRLLEITCEDILSAGEAHVPASTRLTNYIAAFSRDEHEWKAYVNREDSPILNADEFGKTFIDYALEAGNYELLKYMLDKRYIWFVGPNDKDPLTYFTGFGAGTKIEKRMIPYPHNLNILDVSLKMRDELRTNMIALAIRHKDVEILESLHAREIPTLYQMSFFSPPPKACDEYYNQKLMDELIHADNAILEYFSKEFEITDRIKYPNRFIFPFMGKLIEQLIQKNNRFAENMLKDAINHNQYVYEQLASLMADTVQACRGSYYDMTNAAVKHNLTKGILKDLQFYDNGSLVSYFALFPGTKKGLRSNVIQVNAESTDTMISRRISELNELYEAIHHITPNFDGGQSNDDF